MTMGDSTTSSSVLSQLASDIIMPPHSIQSLDQPPTIKTITPQNSNQQLSLETSQLHNNKTSATPLSKQQQQQPQQQPQQQQQQLHNLVPLSPISRNPSSSEETNSEENNSERQASNRSMSSIATSFESVGNRPLVAKYYDERLDSARDKDIVESSSSNFENNTSPCQDSQIDTVSSTTSESINTQKNFPFPQSTSEPINGSVSTDLSNHSISTAKLDHSSSKYIQHSSPGRKLSTSSSASSLHSHKLAAKLSASSLTRQSRNFSTYRSSSPPITPPENKEATTTNHLEEPVDTTSSPLPASSTGIAIDRPVVMGDAIAFPTVVTVKNEPLEAIDPHDSANNQNLKNVKPEPLPPQHASSKLKSAQTISTDRFPLPPNPRLVQRHSSSSQMSAASQRSFHIQDGESKSSGSQQHKTPMAIVRRRSLPPQQLATTHTLLPDERTDFYREQVIAMREMKRKKRKEYEEDERVLVGNKVSEGHANYAAAYYMLTGIRVSVSRCNAKVDRKLTDDDFTASHKLAFDVSGNELIPSSKYDFKFKDYSPWVFRHLREMFKLDPADYLMSLTSKYIVSELSSPGKSGSFFYFSRDYRFIIKTIHHSEHKMLRKILKDYYSHVKNNPNTLISQFYGLHRVKLPFGKKIHFLVMNNLFPPHHDLHRTYDLKGSSLGREYIPKNGEPPKPGAVQKDLNWTKNQEALKLGPINGQMFINQLQRDAALLKRLNIMDYSLLIGIHDKTQGDSNRHSVYVFEPTKPGNDHMKVGELRKAVNSTNPTAVNTLDIFAATFGQRDLAFYNDDGGFQATDSDNQPLPEIYYLGVIDCLTPYTFFKRVETFWKGLSHPRPTISAIPASEYGDRFFKFMKKAVKPPQHQSSNEGNVVGPSRPSLTLSTDRNPQLPVVEETSREVSPKSSNPAIEAS